MIELYEHQEKALEKLKNGSILCGDVGSGKSLVAAAYYMAKEYPKDVVVITTAKKRDSLDWDGEFIRYGIGRSVADGPPGGLTVDSWNNLDKYVDRRSTFFIFDEQRVVGAGAWAKDFVRIARGPGNRWLLLSATPGDTWLDYIPVFLAHGFYKNRTEFLREHVVFTRYAKFPKVERYTSVGRLVKLRNSILVPMPFMRGTTRNVEHVAVDHDRARLERVLKDRWHVYENRPLRDVAELFSVMRKVVNSDSSRLEALSLLMEMHPRLIVFYNFDYELEKLRTLASSSSKKNLDSNSSPGSELSFSNSIKNSKTESSSLGCTCLGADSTVCERCDGATPSEQTSPRLSTAFTEPTPTPANIGSSEELTAPSVFAQAATLPSIRNGLRRTTGSTTKHTTTGSGSPSVPVRMKSHSPSVGETIVQAPCETASAIVVAEWNGHKHEPIPDTDRWVYLVQYQAGAEGWNCIATDSMVFYSLTYSYKNWHQAFGRIDRLNTPFTKLNYYVFMSNSVIDKAIWKALQDKKSFNERKFLSKIKDTPSQKSVFRS